MITPRAVQTSAAVARHYDELDRFYREIWGDHVHHGLWLNGQESPDEAVENLISLLAEKLELKPGQHVCDVGCGYGATAEWLVRHKGVRVTGLTISHTQAQHAMTRAESSPQLIFVEQDWMENTFADAAFDCVISIESSEHMPDKHRFFSESFRTLCPGGRFGIYAWLAKTDPRAWEERYLLEPICREGRIPCMGTMDEYCSWIREVGFVIDDVMDLTASVAPTWKICAGRLGKALFTNAAYRRFLLDARSENRVFALSILRIWLAYAAGSMRYGLVIAQKP